MMKKSGNRRIYTSMFVAEFNADLLNCKVFPDRDEMGRYAAKAVAEKMRELLRTQEEINMVFAAAPSQNDILKYLAREEGLDWSRVTAFHMDEYVGLGEHSPKSFAHYLASALFDRVPLKAVYYIGTGDTEEICKRYEELLKAHPIDIVCLGIGENGHIAFNDPKVADFADKKVIKLVGLDEVCRRQQVNDKTFDTLQEVPRYAVTLTIPTLISAKYMFCVVPTDKKAVAVYRTMRGPIDQAVPATILRRHPHAMMFTDVESAKLLMNG